MSKASASATPTIRAWLGRHRDRVRCARGRLDRRARRRPGTRETALLDPAQTVEGIDAIALSGGSAFGLDAASGVQAWLREQGRGFAVREARVPIVPGAILFDCSTAATRTGAAIRPIASWGTRPRLPAPYSHLASHGAGDDPV